MNTLYTTTDRAAMQIVFTLYTGYNMRTFTIAPKTTMSMQGLMNDRIYSKKGGVHCVAVDMDNKSYILTYQESTGIMAFFVKGEYDLKAEGDIIQGYLDYMGINSVANIT